MKKYSISVLEVPLEAQGVMANGRLDKERFNNSKMKDNMWITAKPLYKELRVNFKDIGKIVNSDYRQYSSFAWEGGLKKTENWNNNNQNLLILDIDDGLTIEEAKSMFSQFTYLIATTKSHRVDKKGLMCDRFRVILPAINVPMGDEYFQCMRKLESVYTFIDTQVNTKTGAFLGSFGCDIYFNHGVEFDLTPFCGVPTRKEEVKTIRNRPINTPISNFNNNHEQIDVEALKTRLTREIVSDVVSSCGFEVNRKFMFKWREGERTPSTSINDSNYGFMIKDFGGETIDVIGFVMKEKGMPFAESLKYIEGFIR